MFEVTPSPLIYLEGIARLPEKKNEFLEKVRKNYCMVINVADTPCAIRYFQEANIPAFWFPILEFGYWGYMPFYATLRAVKLYYDGSKPILIHCHQGAHRSPIVAYTIMRASGMSESKVEEILEYKGLTDIFHRDISKGRIPADIIEFLKTAIKNPMMSIKDIGQLMGKDKDFYRDDDDVVKSTYDVHKLVSIAKDP